jgi:hypothetical protein
MKDETKRKFEEVFAQHKEKLEKEQQATATTKTRERQFLEEFREHRESTITPALRRIGEVLSSTGMRTDVRPESAEGITFVLFVADQGSSGRGNLEQPFLALRPDASRGLVNIEQSTHGPGGGGARGPLHSVKLQQLTEEFLEDTILALVRQVLK